MPSAPDLIQPVRSVLRGEASIEDVERALANGANPNTWDAPLTPVRCAVQANHPQLLRLLLRCRADANAADDRGVAPLHMAVFDGKGVCIKLLLDAAGDPNAKDRNGQTPLFFAPTRQVCEQLIAGRAELEVQNANKQSPLHLAARAGLNDAVAWLIDANRRILDLQDSAGHTPLQYAMKLGPSSTVELLQRKAAAVAAAAAVPLGQPPADTPPSRVPPVNPSASRRGGNQLNAAMRAREASMAAAAAPAASAATATAATDQPASAARSTPVFDRTEPDYTARAMESEDSQQARAENRVPNKEVRQEEVDGCLEWTVTLRKESAADKFGFVQANGKVEFESRLANPSRRAVAPESCNPLRPPEDSPLKGPNVFIVRRIHEGALLHRWNLRHPKIAVQPNDRIVSVNGECSLEGMQREIKSPQITIKFVRYPEIFALTLRKGDRRLGFRFERPPSGTRSDQVRFTEVLAEGALPEYNREQVAAGRFQFVVLPDMRIVRANSISGDGAEIAEELKRCSEVKLIVRRGESSSSGASRARSAARREAEQAPNSGDEMGRALSDAS